MSLEMQAAEVLTEDEGFEVLGSISEGHKSKEVEQQ